MFIESFVDILLVVVVENDDPRNERFHVNPVSLMFELTFSTHKYVFVYFWHIFPVPGH